MAQLIGGLGTSHIPAIGGAIHKGLQQDPYWKPFLTASRPFASGWARKSPTCW
jgi:protocatechuate 4,5-dioxygenase beta chain